jgi:hypothetical protein
MFSIIFPKIMPFMDNVEKYGGAKEAADNMAHVL